MNEDLMALNSIAESLDELVNQVMKHGKPSSQIVKKVFTRSGQVDGGEKDFEPRLWVEVFFVPYPLGVYLLKEAFEVFEDDPDSFYDVKILRVNHEWEAQESGLTAYRKLQTALEDRVFYLNESTDEPEPDPREDYDDGIPSPF